MPRPILLVILLVMLAGACQSLRPAVPECDNRCDARAGRLYPAHSRSRHCTRDGYLLCFLDRQPGALYLFKDKVVWEFCGRVFEKNPAWTREITRTSVDIWAPDISSSIDQWHLYLMRCPVLAVRIPPLAWQPMSLSTPTARSMSGWTREKCCARSGDSWNAIDPNLVLDENGEPWLAWGSFWEGIWMRKMDRASGKLDPNDPTVHQLAIAPPDPITLLPSRRRSSRFVADTGTFSSPSINAVRAWPAPTTCVQPQRGVDRPLCGS